MTSYGHGYGWVDENNDGINDRFIDENGDGLNDLAVGPYAEQSDSYGYMSRHQDANGDGIDDMTGMPYRNGFGWIDENSDGINDVFADANGDGVNDYFELSLRRWRLPNESKLPERYGNAESILAHGSGWRRHEPSMITKPLVVEGFLVLYPDESHRKVF